MANSSLISLIHPQATGSTQYPSADSNRLTHSASTPTMSTDPAQPQAQACGIANPEPENPFRFTPIKALRALPRLWERKPTTPYRAGAKSRKLWKRFQSSFSGMKTLEQSDMFETDALQTAINTSKDAGYVRGVKRLCVGSEQTEGRVDTEQPGRSFLETKWESGASRKRRKLPDTPFEIYNENLQDTHMELASQSDAPANEPDESASHLAMTASPTPIDNLNSPAADGKAVEDLESSPADQDPCTEINSAAAAENSNTTTAVQDLTHEQEGKLVRSALRSSLDGEDAELLNDFLSKAKAKRAAKAALADPQDTEAEESSPEECSTPRSRRALEDIDTNSPSPIKVQVPSSKGDPTAAEEGPEDIVSKDQDFDEPAPASPACRRSTRVKAPSANAPAVRNTISLRRAKGTEFVFLQRTEAQELALATKRNTRKNRGNSVFPKYALQAMAERDNENPATGDVDRQEQVDHQGSSSRRSAAVQKHVSWKEERLVQYEDDDESQPQEEPEEVEEGDSKRNEAGSVPVTRSGSKRSDKKAAASSSARSSRSQVQQQGSASGEPQEVSSTSTTATPRSRRVRRLGDSTTGVSGTPVKTGSGRISKPPAMAAAGPSTPTKGRRKLVPKSPSSSLLPAPSSKTEQPLVSGIPTRSASSSSERTKRKSMIQANAGSTPMPRRVRART